jgi:hypothetical protein
MMFLATGKTLQNNKKMIKDDDAVIQEMFDLIQECNKEESFARTQFESLIQSNSHPFELHLQNIDEIRHQITVAEQRAHHLATNINKVYDNADSVSSKVRQSHLIMDRVREVIEAIEGNIGMKSCLQGVEEAIKDEDYEKAAQLVSRVFDLSERQKLKKREESELDSRTLQEADRKIKEIVKTKFVENIESKNENGVNRFAKLFVPLRMEQEGLEIYCKYLVNEAKQEIASVVNDVEIEKISDLTSYNDDDEDDLNNLNRDTKSFVDFLREAVDIGHHYIVEYEDFIMSNFGGREKMTYYIQKLQSMLEEHVNYILTLFVTKRKVKERSLQVQKKLRSPQNRQQPRTSHHHHHHHHQEMSPEGPDPKDLDLVLEEMAHLCQAVQIYEQFIQNKIKSYDNSTNYIVSNMSIKMQEIMSRMYLPLDEYFMRQSIGKAIQYNQSDSEYYDDHDNMMLGNNVHHYSTDEASNSNNDSDNDESSDHESDESDEEADDTSKCSSLIDDVFYILQKSMERAVSTHSVTIVCATLNNMNTVLTTGSFSDELHKSISKIRGDKRGEVYSVRDLKLILKGLNNMETTSNYTIKLKLEFEKMMDPILKSEHHGKSEKMQVKSIAAEFVDTSLKLSTLVERSIKRLVSSSLDTTVSDELHKLLDNVSYNLSDEDYNKNTMQYLDQFIHDLNSTIKIYERNLTTSNFDRMIQDVLVLFTEKFIHGIFKKRFNQLGSWQFDKDLRSIMNYFSTKTQNTIRDKFAKLTQMAFLLKMTSCEEVLDYWGDESGLTSMRWQWNPNEVRRILLLRVDFDSETVNALQL